ncbi:hypothetical protein TrRE_jg56, partial [Triparma retinervis]
MAAETLEWKDHQWMKEYKVSNQILPFLPLRPSIITSFLTSIISHPTRHEFLQPTLKLILLESSASSNPPLRAALIKYACSAWWSVTRSISSSSSSSLQANYATMIRTLPSYFDKATLTTTIAELGDSDLLSKSNYGLPALLTGSVNESGMYVYTTKVWRSARLSGRSPSFVSSVTSSVSRGGEGLRAAALEICAWSNLNAKVDHDPKPSDPEMEGIKKLYLEGLKCEISDKGTGGEWWGMDLAPEEVMECIATLACSVVSSLDSISVLRALSLGLLLEGGTSRWGGDAEFVCAAYWGTGDKGVERERER